MEQFITISGAVILVVVIIFVVIYFNKKAQIMRKLKNAPYRDIKNFTSGETAKIIGNVEFVDSALIAPLSGRKCSYYSILVEQKIESGKSSSWRTIIEEEVSSKFVIKQDSSYAFIADGKLKSYIVLDKNFSSGFLNDASENLQTYLQSKGKDSEGFFGMNKALRYSEGILEENEPIAVYGKGEWRNSEELDLPFSYERVLVITAPENDSVYLSDDPDTLNKNLPE